jgi:YegS/Rv2252/BmrU family lipid kinase
MERKLLFVYNPHAGKAQIRSNLLDIIDIFTKAGYTVTAKPTQKRGDAKEAVLNRSGDYELVVCSGGDGTLDEAVTGMMMRQDRIPIGYVPAGTTNDFARSLKISGNMLRAAEDIVSGRNYACDVGVFNEDVFVYIAAFGLFTDVSYETKQEVKNVLGHMAYILEGAKRISSIPCYHLWVTCDGKTVEGDYMFGMITNSRSVGGFRKITGKNVDMNDGLFEVTLIKMPYNMIELNLILTSILGHKIHSDYMQCFKAKSIRIEGDEEIPWTLDGEYGGSHKEVSIKNEFQGLHLIIPDGKKPQEAKSSGEK